MGSKLHDSEQEQYRTWLCATILQFSSKSNYPSSEKKSSSGSSSREKNSGKKDSISTRVDLELVKENTLHEPANLESVYPNFWNPRNNNDPSPLLSVGQGLTIGGSHINMHDK